MRVPSFISRNTGAWIVDMSVAGISNGRWLLSVDDKYDLYHITLLPGREISVPNKGNTFSCGVDEVTAVGKVVIAMDFVFERVLIGFLCFGGYH